MSIRVHLWFMLLAACGWLLAQAPTDPVFSAEERFDAQARLKVPTTPAPRTADGHPDLSGIWGPDRNFIYDISSALKKGEQLPLQPWAQQLAARRMSKDDPEANCLPAGVPRQAPFPWRIVQTPYALYFLYEGNIHSYRQTFLNMPKHSADVNPTWYGESIGRWDRDTLVIDTVGFNDIFWFDFAGHPHTEKLRVVERFRRPNFGNLDYEVTIDDPGAYTKPFVLYGHSPYLVNTELIEYVCNENNQDVDHITGKDTRK